MLQLVSGVSEALWSSGYLGRYTSQRSVSNFIRFIALQKFLDSLLVYFVICPEQIECTCHLNSPTSGGSTDTMGSLNP